MTYDFIFTYNYDIVIISIIVILLRNEIKNRKNDEVQ